MHTYSLVFFLNILEKGGRGGGRGGGGGAGGGTVGAYNLYKPRDFNGFFLNSFMLSRNLVLLLQ